MSAVDLQDTYIRKNILDARAMATRATELDPDYAYAWIVLAWTYWQEAYSGWGDSIDSLIAQSEKANRKAFALDPDHSEAWGQLSFIHMMKHEPEPAIEACRRAVELEPGSAEIQALTAAAYTFSGDYDQGRKHYRNMIGLCPIRPNWYYLVGGHIELLSGNPERAIELYREGIRVEPDSPLCRFYLINALLDSGEEAAAQLLADEIRALDPEVTGRGLVQMYSSDARLRQRLGANLSRFGLV